MRTLIALLSCFALHMASLGTATPALCIQLEAAGWRGGPLTLTMAAHHVGFAVMALFGPSILRRIGVRGALVLASLGLSAGVLLQDGWLHPAPLGIGRALGGASVAFACLAIEQSLGSIAKSHRGLVLGVYLVLGNLGYGLGSSMATGDASCLPMAALFAASASIPAAFTPLRTDGSSPPPPTSPAASRAPLGWQPLLERAPWALSAAIGGGAATTSMLVVAPLQAIKLDLSPAETTTYLSAIVLMGAAIPAPLGILADRFDRRAILRWTAAAAAASSLVASGIPNQGLALGLSVLGGGLCFGLYPLGVGVAQSQLSETDFQRAGGALLLAAAAGALVGAPIAGALVDGAGPMALPVWVGLWAASTLYLPTLRARIFSPGVLRTPSLATGR